ncbi:nitronate monooxygenase [Monoraphidium neglectum]|uniref:Nitronate monooxygenase n=1 Tax=Monoraphidium neglectum TaxID=145388 RepID=A0A0D2MCK9_9CHLO|nr:nitronate monooxygenase [Monoraphidium neglectum]KIY98566.1 nitronate monooxygenase [Monoraphidium neglectum]|eukprot:XP_013897586.1 nitronate monooxygenase [Monoraphidium neglectum]
MSGSTTPQLVAAVSNAGGLGMYAVGSGLPDASKLPAVISSIREKLAAPDTPFGVNIFVPPPEHYHPQPLSPDESEAVALWVAAYQRRAAALGMATKVAAAPSLPDFHGQWSSFERHVEVMVEQRVPLISFHFGLPRPATLDLIRGAGLLTVACATTVKEARAAEAAGVDFVVVQGAEAGGHRGTFYGEDPRSGLIGTLPLLAAVRAAVSVPVIAAGGIMDGAGVAAVLAGGAAGAWLGTAFLAAAEADVAAWQREAMLGQAPTADGSDDSVDNTVVTRAFTGKGARGLANDLTHELAEVEGTLPNLFELANTRAFLAEARQKGLSSVGIALCGQGHRRLRRQVVGAGQLLAELEAETDAAVGRLLGDG